MSKPLHQASSCQRLQITLGDAIRESGPNVDRQYARAAVMATVLSIGTPVWNSPDGHRWTTAELQAHPEVTPRIYTPLQLHVDRMLSSAAGLDAGQTITAYLHGGTTSTGDSDTDDCVAVLWPHVGWSAAVFLSNEVDTDESGAAPLRKPTGGEFDPVRNGKVLTFFGEQPIP